MINPKTKVANCVCAFDLHCQAPSIVSSDGSYHDVHEPSYNVSGSTIACFIVDSLLRSTLECYYSESCLAVHMSHINFSLNNVDTDDKICQPNSLIYTPVTSRFPPQTLISDIVKQLMVEQWNPVFVFDRYYNSCAPIKCVGPQTANFSIFVVTMITLISSLGGLATLLRFIIPLVIKIIIKLSQLNAKRKRRQQEQPKGNYSCDHIVIKHSLLVHHASTICITFFAFKPR